MKLADLKAAGYNPRQISDEALEGLGKSLARFGVVQPIVWNRRTKTVVGGHQRLNVLECAGEKEVDVVVVDLGVAEEKALNVALNSPAISGEFTGELDTLLDDIQEHTPDVYDDLLLAELRQQPEEEEDTEEDEVPAAPKKPKTRKGDLWLLGENRLLCGDSANATDVERLMAGEKARLFATDPPYGVDYSKVKDGIPRPGFKDHQKEWGDIANDGLEDKALQEFLEGVFAACLPYLENAAWYLWHAHLTQGFFAPAAAAAADVFLHRQIIWRKPGFVLTRSGMYHWAHEPCFFGWQRGNKPAWLGEKNQRSVWEIGRDDDSGQHPTQKPIEVFAIPIRNHLKKGEVCLEPFSGSGSQIIAAEQLGRRCFAMEIEPRYADVAVKRWENLTGKRAKREGRK